MATVTDALMFVRGMIAEAEEGFLSIGDLRDLEEMLSSMKTSGQRVSVRGASSSRGRSTSKKKRKSAYQAAYSKAFKKVAPNYKKKDGSWRKGGFAAAGRAARRDPAVRRAKKK